MKNKRIKIEAFIGLLILMFFGCGSNPVQTASTTNVGMDLDVAIRNAATQMETRISSGTMVALVSLASPSTAFSTQVLTRLESAIVSNGKLIVVDRANLDKVRAEQGFQLSGEVDDESAKSIGKLLGAGAIVTGSLSDLGDVYSLSLKAINIETATVAVSYLSDLTKTTRIETLLATRDGAGSGGTSIATTSRPTNTTQTDSAQVTIPVSTQPVYKVGDTGPAGGFIFYDKGNNSGGWRYLEAAPADIPQRLYMSTDTASIVSQRVVGTGKSNTQAIMVQANNLGGGFGWAAQACTAFDYNGFNDWFLPSRDELNYMYGNLHMKNLGGFNSDWYWSSTYSNLDNFNGSNMHNWWSINFFDGSQTTLVGNRNARINSSQIYVRPIRQF